MTYTDHLAKPQRYTEEREILYQLAYDLARSPDVHTIADHLFVRVRALLNVDYGALLLVNEKTTELKGIASYGLDDDVFQQERIDLQAAACSPVALAFQQRQPIVTTDGADNSLVSIQLREKYGSVQSAWIVPLLSGDKAVGILLIGYQTQRAATQEELQLLQLLG